MRPSRIRCFLFTMHNGTKPVGIVWRGEIMPSFIQVRDKASHIHGQAERWEVISIQEFSEVDFDNFWLGDSVGNR